MRAGGKWDHDSFLHKDDRGLCAAAPLGHPTEGIRAELSK